MKVEFTPEAEHELTEASLWYESKEPGLGIRFRTELQRVVRRASEDPTLWRMREGGYRRVNCPVFPYFIAYIVRGETIVIIAVAHSHRKPDYWVDRYDGDLLIEPRAQATSPRIQPGYGSHPPDVPHVIHRGDCPRDG